MFAGHVGAALAIGSADRRVNVGAFVFAALLLDIALWLFVLLDLEFVTIPANFASTHQPEFVFPYSHSLFGCLAWSAVSGAAAFLWYSRRKAPRLRAAALTAGAVFSHWLLDAIVHVPELPLAGAGSLMAGLGLWQNMPIALFLEAVLVLGGLWLFVSGAGLSRTRQLWLSVLAILILAFTVVGMTIAPSPPSVTAMAMSSLVMIIAVCALALWLGRPPE